MAIRKYEIWLEDPDPEFETSVTEDLWGILDNYYEVDAVMEIDE